LQGGFLARAIEDDGELKDAAGDLGAAEVAELGF